MSLFVSNVVHVFYQNVSIFKVIYLINSQGVKTCAVCLCLSDSTYSRPTIMSTSRNALSRWLRGVLRQLYCFQVATATLRQGAVFHMAFDQAGTGLRV